MRSTRAWPLAIALLVALPVFFGVGYSMLTLFGFAGAGATGELSWERATRVFTSATTWRGAAWSCYVAAVSTLLATVGAAAVALLFPSGSRADRFARSISTMPLPVPHLVAAATALFVLGQSGLLARIAFQLGLIALPADMPALVYDKLGVSLILSLAWKELPFLAVVAIALRGLLSDRLHEAATTLGASSSQIARRITWPLLWRGLMPAVVATFVFAFGSFESAVLLAPVDPAPLPVLTMERFADPELARRGEAYGLALIGFAVAGIAVAAHEWMRARWVALIR